MFKACRISLCAALWVVAASQVAADLPPPEPQPNEEVKLPWTAEDARKAWGNGVSFLFDTKMDDKSGWMRWEVEAITEKGFKSTQIECEAGKAPNHGKQRDQTWEKHVSGLQRELRGAEKSTGKVEVPFGQVDCDIFTITKKNVTQKFALSAKVPGMVVMMEREATVGEARTHMKYSLRSMDAPICASPWTFDKIAANFKPGTKTIYAGKSSDGDAKIEYEVTASDITGMTFTAIESEQGKEAKKNAPMTVTWDAYLRFFVPPRHNAATSEETLKTAAGDFACVVYAVVRESEGVKYAHKVWLAKDQPGLMVRCDVSEERGDKKMFYSLELAEFSKGK